MKEWITIAEASALTGRSRRAIYVWVQSDRLASQIIDGRVHVLAKAVARIAPTVKRGRPRGSPTRR
ncbi:hypothetical protein [Microbacterium sp.]|uniref:hypothetical protein n=1 Tax=Microbacterium sp. TaxID=51671 RepID=UPI0026128A90|nr:hypothetical protein [Microbacterium sp.]